MEVILNLDYSKNFNFNLSIVKTRSSLKTKLVTQILIGLRINQWLSRIK